MIAPLVILQTREERGQGRQGYMVLQHMVWFQQFLINTGHFILDIQNSTIKPVFANIVSIKGLLLKHIRKCQSGYSIEKLYLHSPTAWRRRPVNSQSCHSINSVKRRMILLMYVSQPVFTLALRQQSKTSLSYKPRVQLWHRVTAPYLMLKKKKKGCGEHYMVRLPLREDCLLSESYYLF